MILVILLIRRNKRLKFKGIFGFLVEERNKWKGEVSWWDWGKIV